VVASEFLDAHMNVHVLVKIGSLGEFHITAGNGA